MKYISATIVQNIIKHDCAMIMSLWKQSLSCITAVLGRAFHPWSFKNGGETVWQHNFQQLHTDTNDSVLRFYFFLSAISIILHWKIASTSLSYSFHSTPNSCCFVYVHFQSHNAPNLPPLHISEMGYKQHFELSDIIITRDYCIGLFKMFSRWIWGIFQR